jgi:hypothetical protein
MWLFEDGNQFGTLGDEKCYEDGVSMMCGGVVVVCGGGDIATGTICRLHHCGYKLLVRGMIRNQTKVAKDLKIGDIDPHIDEVENCYTISDKARCISGWGFRSIAFLSRK